MQERQLEKLKNLLQSIERPQQRKVKQSSNQEGGGAQISPTEGDRANLKNI